ncbi:hypothetical protein ABPG74_014148 [Tetrahymena malaccensis]
MNLQNEILIIQYQQNSLFYFSLQNQFQEIDQAYKFIENTNLNEDCYQDCRVVLLKQNEIDAFTKLIKQSLQKLYKVYQYHSNFIYEIQNSWECYFQARQKQISHRTQQQEDEKQTQNLNFESLALNMIQNLESFLIKITEKEDFIDCLYNPTKIIMSNLKQFKMNEFHLIFQYEDSQSNPIVFSKQIKIIQSLFNNCPSTIIVDNLNIEVTFVHKNMSNDYELYQNQKQQIIDLTFMNTKQINLNINCDNDDEELQLFELKMKFKLFFHEQFLKLTVKKNKAMVDHLLEYEFFNKQLIFLDQNKKKMLATFLPNYLDNNFLLVLSQARISEQVIDRILSEDQLKLLLSLFNKLNLQNILSNSIYVIMYDLHLDL